MASGMAESRCSNGGLRTKSLLHFSAQLASVWALFSTGSQSGALSPYPDYRGQEDGQRPSHVPTLPTP